MRGAALPARRRFQRLGPPARLCRHRRCGCGKSAKRRDGGGEGGQGGHHRLDSAAGRAAEGGARCHPPSPCATEADEDGGIGTGSNRPQQSASHSACVRVRAPSDPPPPPPRPQTGLGRGHLMGACPIAGRAPAAAPTHRAAGQRPQPPTTPERPPASHQNGVSVFAVTPANTHAAPMTGERGEQHAQKHHGCRRQLPPPLCVSRLAPGEAAATSSARLKGAAGAAVADAEATAEWTSPCSAANSNTTATTTRIANTTRGCRRNHAPPTGSHTCLAA